MSLKKGIIAFSPPLLSTLVFLLLGVQICVAQNISRASFPNGFVFGTASSAYQYEGAVKEDGRGSTIWDKFAQSFGKIIDFSNANVTEDQYHRYQEDVELMKDMGVDAYRFSIAWSRIFPNGTGEINQAGIDHYNNLIDALLAKGVTPYVTLYHWDLPQALDDRYGGWLDPQIIKDFATYAETCFKKFGDKVKHWITVNEPHSVALRGYGTGIHAPGRCSIRFAGFCKAGNSSTEPYIVGHNLLLAHATIVDIYRKSYQQKQQGSVAITIDSFWYEPMSNSTADIEATQRAIDFYLGWFLEPVITGDYPKSMRRRVGERLPVFSAAESALVKGSYDFIGINHYTTWYATNDTGLIGQISSEVKDSGALTLPFKGLQPIGDKAHSIWLYIVPRGIRSLVNHIKQKYGNPIVLITENGMDNAKDASLDDTKRINYHNDYLTNLLAAIKEDGCNVKGYFAWSLLDNWEWNAGFSSRFGIIKVDYNDKLKRIPKDSFKWFKNFLTT
ncbi:PREDICTED: beta-glucosidase 40-like [Ipomoea nil]|uniref:beta-glucosidase 40-like n=1 Tax=Ipomoea nil TaxID=35883 RepID=UPI00090162E3|nr:PREDICTED: beta-glucosidase 40-like [Ipomoea nil]